MDLVDKALEPVIDQVFLYNVWQSDEVVLTVRALDAIFLEAFLRDTQLFSNPFPLDEQKVRDMTYLFPQRIDITTMTSFDRSYFNEHLEDWWDELDHPFKSEYASILRLKEKINSRGFDNTVEIRNGFGTARKLIWRVIEIIDTATIHHLRYDNNPYEKKKQIVEDLLTKNFGHVIGFLSMLHQYQISKVKRNDLNSYITVSFDGEWNISFDHLTGPPYSASTF